MLNELTPKAANTKTNRKEKITIFDCLSGTMIYRGYIEVDKIVEDIEEYCWELCNWSNWALKKPENLFSDVDDCSHGICFYIHSRKLYCLALSRGWLHFTGKEDLISYIKKNKDKQIWKKERE